MEVNFSSKLTFMTVKCRNKCKNSSKYREKSPLL